MKLKKWEKDLCKAFVGMYIAKNIEINVSEWEYEISRNMGDFNSDHRELIKNYLLTLI